MRGTWSGKAGKGSFSGAVRVSKLLCADQRTSHGKKVGRQRYQAQQIDRYNISEFIQPLCLREPGSSREENCSAPSAESPMSGH